MSINDGKNTGKITLWIKNLALLTVFLQKWYDTSVN